MEKQKYPNLGPKIPDLSILGLECENNIATLKISTLEFVKYESLTHTVNFAIGSAFFKVPGPAFCEGPGLGPGRLYKVCSILLQ